jgi:hypothetical protein
MMASDFAFFPHAMTIHDLSAMREAVSYASAASGAVSTPEMEGLARIVLRFYRCGMTDPEILGNVAVFLSSSRVFNAAKENSEAPSLASLRN